MATVLATLVLDEGAMELVRQRGEGHLVFEATLRLLVHVVTQLKLRGVHSRNDNGSGDPDSQVAPTPDQEWLAPAPQHMMAEEGAGTADVMPLGAAQLSTAEKLAAGPTGNAHVAATAGASHGQHNKELLDLQAAVQLAEACAQALWGAAHYSLTDPLFITQVYAVNSTLYLVCTFNQGPDTSMPCTVSSQPHCHSLACATVPPLLCQDHIIQLGKLALDCLLIAEADLGRVCHCLGESHAALHCMLLHQHLTRRGVITMHT
jgi:hypothetical protein